MSGRHSLKNRLPETYWRLNNPRRAHAWAGWLPRSSWSQPPSNEPAVPATGGH